jgi:hypothetical protein
LRLLLLVLALGAMLAAHARIQAAPPVSAASFAPRPELARLAAFGFESLTADLLWLRAVQQIGREDRSPLHDVAGLARLLRTVVALDPWVGHPYRFAAVWLVDSVESVRLANQLLERGIAYHPLDWRNRFYLSFNYFFYLGETVPAAHALEPAIGLAGAPAYLGRLLARLRSHDGGLEAATGYLTTLLQNTEDPALREQYEGALLEIETEHRARVLDRARLAYRQRHGRDIGSVEDLIRGPEPILPALPPEPHGSSWRIDEETGAIVSSFLSGRYRLHMHPIDRERQERWERERNAGRAMEASSS